MSILIHKTLLCIVRMLILFYCSLLFCQEYYPSSKHLENGLAYYVKHNRNPSNKTIFCLAVNVGSINENKDQLGYAHFLEHMAFKGGKRFRDKSFTQYLQEQGIQIGIHYNAVTNYDYTIYTIEIPQKSSKEVLTKTMNFFADILEGLYLEQKAINSEKRVIIEEKRVSEPPNEHYNFKLGNSLYAQRLAIGTDFHINRVTHNKLNEFYQKWYQPNNAAVFVIGDIIESQVEKVIEDTFSGLQNNGSISNDFSSLYQSLDSDVKILASENNKVSKVYLQWAYKHKIRNLHQTIRQKTTRYMFNKLLKRRLDTLLKSTIEGVRIHSNFFLSDVSYNTIEYKSLSDISLSIEKILTEMKRMALHGVSEKELMYSTQNILANTTPKKEQLPTSSIIIDKIVDEYLGLEVASSAYKEDELERKILQNITVEAIKKEAREVLLNPKLRVLVEQSSEEKYMSFDLDKLNHIIKIIEKKTLKPVVINIPLKKKEIVESIALKTPLLLPKIPLQRNYFSKTGITKVLYKNGVEVFFKPLKNDNDEIKISGNAVGGTSAIPDSLYYQYEFATSYLELGGIANLNSKQLSDYLDNKEFGVSLSVSEFERNIHGYSNKTQISEFFKYLYSKMVATTVDTVEFNSVVKEEIASLNKQSSYTPRNYDKIVARIKNRYFPQRKHATTRQDFERLDIFRMKKFYDDYINNAFGWKFVITGNFSVDSILPLTNTFLANLQPKNILANRQLLLLNEISNTIVIPQETLKKTTATTILIHKEYTPSLKNSILSSLTEKYLQYQITNALRQKYGLVYTPYVSIEENRYCQPTLITEIKYRCKPKNTLKSKRIIFQLFDQISQNTIDVKTLSSFKKSVMLKFRTVMNSKDSYLWNTALLNTLSNANYIEELEGFEDVLKKITSQELKQFLNEILSSKKSYIITEK